MEKDMENTYYVHPSSVIDNGSVIGKGTKIWHFCHVMGKSIIGEECILGQNVFVGDNVVLGKGVKVQNNVSIYDGVICEDFVFLGPSMVFTNVTNPRSAINKKDEFAKTMIKKGATIGANATILCGITIGKYAFVGAGAVITKDIEDYALYTGVPGIFSGWMSEEGEKLTFDINGEAEKNGIRYLLKENKVIRE